MRQPFFCCKAGEQRQQFLLFAYIVHTFGKAAVFQKHICFAPDLAFQKITGSFDQQNRAVGNQYGFVRNCTDLYGVLLLLCPGNEFFELFFTAYTAADKLGVKKILFVPNFFTVLAQMILIVQFEFFE